MKRAAAQQTVYYKVHEPTGVSLKVLEMDARTIGLIAPTASIFDLQMNVSIFQLARHCHEQSVKPTIAAPNKEDFRTFNAYKLGEVLAKNVKREKIEALKAKTDNLIVEPMFDDDGYNTARRRYTDYKFIVRQVFIWGLYYLTDTMETPKAPAAYAFACEHTSNDFSEIAEFYESMLQFIK